MSLVVVSYDLLLMIIIQRRFFGLDMVLRLAGPAGIWFCWPDKNSRAEEFLVFLLSFDKGLLEQVGVWMTLEGPGSWSRIVGTYSRSWQNG